MIPMILRGVDGCPGGWLAVSLDLSTGRVVPQVFSDAESLLRDAPAAVVTAIDIPIGLPSGRRRAVDGEARRLLGPRASSVFPAPPRSTLTAESYQAACGASLADCGKSLSQQSYAILPKIRDVDAVLRQDPQLSERVLEVHPELCFYFWAGRRPMRHSKRSGFGFAERLDLVRTVFGQSAEAIREAVPRADAGDDDILDSLAALWTAQRIHSGAAVRLPAMEERDGCGLPMQMLA
jgi:predicted RNase H-like nuclease